MARGQFKQPDPHSFVAKHPGTGAKLYAELAAVPLYANMRLIAPKLVGRRQSFYLGWIIKEQRMAKGRDAALLPPEIQQWIIEQISALYPDHETATGMTPEEVAELEAEQKLKREQHKK